MPTIADQLTELVNQKKALVSNLNTKGVSATEDEKLNTLVPKVLEITSGGTDTSDATATSNDILNGKTAYVKGAKIEGNIPSKSQETYTPTTYAQYINSGQYLSGIQTINGDTNLLPENIKNGTSIFNVIGNHVGIETLTESNATSEDIKNGKIVYGNNGEKITGSAYAISQTVTITPSVDKHYLLPGFYNGINIPGDTDLVASNIKKDVEIFGITGTYEGTDTSDATATAADILTGKTAYVNGEKLTGTIPTYGAHTYTPTTENQYFEPGSYITGVQCIKGDANLLPGNIRKGVSIFNVEGIYEGSQSSAEQILFQCDDSATEESIISEYGSIIQVNNSSPASFGNLSNFEDKKISAISNSMYEMKGLSYRVENDYSGFYFKTPFAITSSNCLLCMRSFVSTWINPTIHFNFIQADSVDDIPTKIENSDFILTKTVSVANSMNNNKIFYDFSIAPGEYYLYVSLNSTGGNEAITNYISILNI